MATPARWASWPMLMADMGGLRRGASSLQSGPGSRVKGGMGGVRQWYSRERDLACAGSDRVRDGLAAGLVERWTQEVLDDRPGPLPGPPPQPGEGERQTARRMPLGQGGAVR